MNDNENIEINLDDDNENIDIDREDSIYTNISEEEINEIRSRIEANEDNIVVLRNESGNKIALSINSNYVMTLQLLNKNNEVLSTGTIDLPIESMVVNASYRNGVLTLTLQNGQTLDVDISDIVSGLVSETTFNNAVSRLEGLISGLDTRMTTAENNIANKVDKVSGKGLSTNDYTTAEKNKLAELENYDDTEVKESIQENANSITALTEKHDTEVAELNEKIADLQEQVDMASDLIPTGDESGSDITVNDSARYYFKKFEVEGKSEQETYTGKNKLDVSSQYTITQADDLKRKLHIEPNVTYKITFDNLEKGGNNNPSIIINGTVVIPVTNNRTFSITEEMTSANIYSNGSSYAGSEGITSTITNFMISEEGGDYEPYTNGPAPNPTYECPIQNVTGDVEVKVENIELNTISIKQGLYSISNNGRYETNDSYVCSNDFLEVTGGKRIFVTSTEKKKGTYFVLEYNQNKTLLEYKRSDSNITEYEITVRDDTKYILIDLGNSNEPCTPSNTGSFNVTTYYEEQTAIFPLSEGMEMCKIRNYADSLAKQEGKWYKKKMIDKGTISSIIQFYNDGLGNTYAFFMKPTNSKDYNVYNTNTMYSKGNITGYGNPIWYGIFYKTGAYTDEEIREKCIGTEYYYVLKEPIYEEITDQALITQLDKIDKLYSYKGTTHITSEAVLDVTYRKDPNLAEQQQNNKLEELEARLDLLEG